MSAQQFSSLPALTDTRVSSSISPRQTRVNATGSDLFERQCGGRGVTRKLGEPVLTSWPGPNFLRMSCRRQIVFRGELAAEVDAEHWAANGSLTVDGAMVIRDVAAMRPVHFQKIRPDPIRSDSGAGF